MECEEGTTRTVGSCNGQGGAFGSYGTFSLQVSRGSRGHDNWPGIIIPRGGPVRKRSNVLSQPSRSPRKVPPQFPKWLPRLQRLEKVEGCPVMSWPWRGSGRQNLPGTRRKRVLDPSSTRSGDPFRRGPPFPPPFWSPLAEFSIQKFSIQNSEF